MIYLFIHQNFPAQYVHLVRHLASSYENRVYFITQSNDQAIDRVQKLLYDPEPLPSSGFHPYNSAYDSAVRTGLAVLQVCRGLRMRGIIPDIIVGHSGWGETLLVKEAFPYTPVLAYFEFFYHSEGADVGFDPEFSPKRDDDGARLFLRNAVARMSFASCDWGHTATHWQRSLFPSEMRARITTLHEGIDTDIARPNNKAWLRLARNDTVLTPSDEVITYVARNLEPYRGFHCFMRALPELLRRRPNAHIVIVGGDGISYGEPPPYGGCYREMMLVELGNRVDRERIHFLGQVPKTTYINVLQVSSVHIYFTYPFVLSWSLLEAMSAGCLVLGSNNLPVSEVLHDEENGLMVDPFDPSAVCDRIDEVFDHTDRMGMIRQRARATIVGNFDLRKQLLPRWMDLLESISAGRCTAERPALSGLPIRAAQS